MNGVKNTCSFLTFFVSWLQSAWCIDRWFSTTTSLRRTQRFFSGPTKRPTFRCFPLCRRTDWYFSSRVKGWKCREYMINDEKLKMEILFKNNEKISAWEWSELGIIINFQMHQPHKKVQDWFHDKRENLKDFDKNFTRRIFMKKTWCGILLWKSVI